MSLNDSGVKPIWKNDVLVYLGDTEFFKRKFSKFLHVPDDVISREISVAVDGIVIELGSKAFKEEADKDIKIGDKIMFSGHYGSIFSRKKPTDQDQNNRAYYRIIPDKDFKGFCTQKEEFESFI